jgi:hypothetical protein
MSAVLPVIIAPAGYYVVDKYLYGMQSLGQYFSNDVSASFRLIEDEHFEYFFQETMGLGFGFMSGSPEYLNVIAFSANYAGRDYGVGDYGLGLDDIGFWSALYQYGYFGLAITIFMTAQIILRMIRYKGSDRTLTASLNLLGLLTLGFMLSPISMNYFTLFYTAHLGMALWMLAHASDHQEGFNRTIQK